MAASRRKRILEAGTRAPEFRLTRLEGGEVTTADLVAQGPFLLAFFKVTCPVCQLTLPFLDRLNPGNGALPVYGVSQNDPEDTREFNHEFGIAFPTLLDREDDHFPVSNAFGISSVPSLFLIDGDGKIERVVEGWSRRDIEWLGGRAGVSPIRPGEHVPEYKAG